MKAEAERFATSVNVLPLHHLDARHPWSEGFRLVCTSFPDRAMGVARHL